MATRTVLAAYLLTASWQFCMPWGQEDPATWQALTAAAFLVLTLRLNASPRPAESVPERGLALLGLVLLTAFLPMPYRIGPAALAGATALRFLPHIRPVRILTVGLGTFGALHVAQTLTVALFHRIGGHLNSGVLAGPASLLLRLAGVDVVSRDGMLMFPEISPRVDMVPSPNNAGAIWVVMALAATAYLAWRYRAGWRRLLLVATTVCAAGFVRFLVMLLLAKSRGTSHLLWEAWPTILSLSVIFLPLWLLRPTSSGAGDAEPAAAGSVFTLRTGLLRGLQVAGAGLIVFGLTFEDPGVRHTGKVIVEERHSDWEWTDLEFDTNWYGRKSTYNFWNWAEHLARFYPIERNYEPITPELLADCSTLILKVPTKSYDESEIRAVVDFVEAGGGLVLIGDHTNVFGSSDHLNSVARHFGIEYRFDSQYDLGTGKLSHYMPPRILPHPVVVNMPPMLFAGGCTLNTDLRASTAILGYRNMVLPGDYSQRSFFPKKGQHTDYWYGTALQVSATTRGDGRVVAFTDSTMFSNFFIHMQGKPELALGMVEWAYRRNSQAWVGTLSLLFGLAFLLLGAIGTRNTGRVLPLTLLSVGVVAALFAAQWLNAAAYTPAEPIRPFTTVAFEADHSRFFIPDHRLRGNRDKSFDSFYVWTQRLGLVPDRVADLPEALGLGEVVVLIDPVGTFSDREITGTVDFVERGGSLFILDDRRNEKSTAAELLAAFEVDLTFPEVKEAYFRDDRFLNSMVRGAGHLSGLEPVVTTPDGRVMLGRKLVGEGILMVCANSRMFEDPLLGFVSTVPQAHQRRMAELEFAIFRYLSGQEKELKTNLD